MMKSIHSVSATLACLASFYLTGVGASALPAAASAAAASQPSATPKMSVKITDVTGPVYNTTLGDPCIVLYKGEYYAYATNGKVDGESFNVPFAKSNHKLSIWTFVGDALPPPSKHGFGVGSWALDSNGYGSDLWTPDVSQLSDGRFIMYYSAKAAGNEGGGGGSGNERCIGVAYADHPAGPFEPYVPKNKFAGAWYCPPAGGAIGVDGILDGEDRYVVFKNGSDVPHSHIGLWRVNATTGFEKIGPGHELTTDPLHQGYEGPAMTKMPDGRWLLLHTTGTYRVDYAIHWAIANSLSDHIVGNYSDQGVLLKTTAATAKGATLYRPGGPDFVGNSSTEIFFFAEDEKDSVERKLYYAELSYSG